jgi:uncharacterized protein (DUF4415 family)
MREKEHNFGQAQRGAVVKSSSGKTRITIRIDTDILNWFRNQVHEAGGGNYQTRVNEALRQHVESQDRRLENTLRKVLREELPAIR